MPIVSQSWNPNLLEPLRPAQGLLCFLITDVINSNLIRRQKLRVAERRYGSISSLSFGISYVLVHDRGCLSPCHPQPVYAQAKREYPSLPGNPAPFFHPPNRRPSHYTTELPSSRMVQLMLFGLTYFCLYWTAEKRCSRQ